MSASHFDIDFNREAFGNFYRCTEAFVTRKVLGVKRLQNELKDMQGALEKLGADADLQAAFESVYKTRSNQVAHAQKQQVKITFDEVLLAKVFADMVMYKVYRRQAEARRPRA